MKKLLLSVMCAGILLAAPYKTGQTVAPIEVNDQFGKHHVLKTMPKTLIMAFDKGTGTTVNEYLAAQDKSYLDKHGAAFIADISQMPRFVTEMFALPKMRKYPHTVLLIEDEEQGMKYPYQEDKITIMTFNGNVLGGIDFVTTAAELKKAIEK